MLLIALALPLAFSTADTMPLYSTQIETRRTDCIEPLQTITPFDQAIVSNVNQYVYSWESFSGHGDIHDFVNLIDVDSDYARLVEVDIDTTIFVAFSLERAADGIDPLDIDRYVSILLEYIESYFLREGSFSERT